MIPQFEIKEFARKSGVPETTVEKDYAQNWLLASLSKLKMEIKGGSGIRKVYFGDYRFSDDLDFTLLNSFILSTPPSSISKAVKEAKERVESVLMITSDLRKSRTDMKLRSILEF